MDWWVSALLTAGTVAVVLGVARRAGQRFAGLVAGLPTVTAPALLWLVRERGLSFAVSAAIGSVSACAMLAAFALLYALVARHRGVGAALAGGLLGALALAVPALLTSNNLAAAVLLALAACAMAFVAMPGRRAGHARCHRADGRAACTTLAAGGLSVLAATVGPALGSFATGLLSSLPVVSGVVVAVEHAAGGGRAAAQFLRGYLAGVVGKIAFGAAFVLLARPLGAAWALTLACACTCLATTLVSRLSQPAGADPVLPGLSGEAVS